ncbi:ROK family transcriptional regulator [Actinoallomurus rhizosphaericola]|uniref:ROK family transcriptional regulator n=1 Tax=Actinoallomurus rhizosphaericola TaxID=2952536 RepID=UPI002110EDC4|nr:ROK family transcriptional regulator [Actinoallomurus rhizosphaericola]
MTDGLVRSPWTRFGLTKGALRLAEALRTEGPSTRARLSRRTGMSRPTVSAAVTELKDHGLITSEEENETSGHWPGRPPETIFLTRKAGLAVGVDLGRSHISVVLTSLGHQPIDKISTGPELDSHVHPRNADLRPTDATDKVVELVNALLTRNHTDAADVIGVGLGIPAPVTLEGVVGSPTLLPGWADFSPGPNLSEHLGVPVIVENDASLGCLGEALFGPDQPWREIDGDYELTFVKVGTGIGAGTVRNGRLHRGADGTAGELGHITLNYLERDICPCGNHGCLEFYVGGLKLLEQAHAARARTIEARPTGAANRLPPPRIDSVLDLASRAKEGDRFCRTLIEDAGDLIGIALGTLVNLNSPNTILIGGALSTAGEILLDPIRNKLARTAMSPAANAVHLDLAKLGRWSTAWGAAAIVLQTPAGNL